MAAADRQGRGVDRRTMRAVTSSKQHPGCLVQWMIPRRAAESAGRSARLLDHQRVGRISEAKSANRLHAADYAFG
jgi:hypothetical protein